MNYWQKQSADICHEFATDCEQGLTESAAAFRLKKYGLNKLPEKERFSAVFLLARQFYSLSVGILSVAMVISLTLGDVIDAVLIGGIILLNSFIGFIQEYRAERSLEALKKLTQPRAYVKRNNEIKQIDAVYIVPGDIVMLNAGDLLCADGRIVLSHDLAIDESALTGESTPVEKIDLPLESADIALADRLNMAYAGTLCMKGSGHMIVTATGAATELGLIATVIKSASTQFVAHDSIRQLMRLLIVLSVSISALIFAIGLSAGTSLVVVALTALSVMVAAIPEGLPVIMTVGLARSVRRMIKRNVLIRRLTSIETLGSVSVICADKTGTLTENRMTVTKIALANHVIDVSMDEPANAVFQSEGQMVDRATNATLIQALQIGVLCNTAVLQGEGADSTLIGDPTEGALLKVAKRADIHKEILEAKIPLLQHNAFDSQRKRMSMLRKTDDGPILYVKGAYDSIIPICTYALIDNVVKPLSSETRSLIAEQHSVLTSHGLRVLAVAYQHNTENEHDLIFVGLFGMMDPPRAGITNALAKARSAGIRTIMITGDHPQTAQYIARAIGLIHNHDENYLITGVELDHSSDKKLRALVKHVKIFARVSAEHKIRIVKALQSHAEIVAMTGDGVNDAPAITLANIGIAMGITGTEITKNAADIIITDDNFNTIISAIEEGRGFHELLIKCTHYLISSNLAELCVIFFGSLIGFIKGADYLVFLPIHILWINFISHGLPAMALAFDPLHPNLMDKHWQVFTKSILSKKDTFKLGCIAVVIALAVIVSFLIGRYDSFSIGQTMAFTTLILLEFVRLSLVRREYNVALWSNKLLIGAIAVSASAQLLLLYVPPLQMLFATAPLSMKHWLIMIGNAAIATALLMYLFMPQQKTNT